VLRFAFFYGLNDPFTDQLIGLARAGWLPLLGRRDAYFPMVTHDDAAAAVVAAMDAPDGIYNVVDDQPMTHEAMADALSRILRVRRPKLLPAWVARLGGSLGETLARSLRISNAKLKGATGWTPSVPNVEDGFRRAVAANQ
jgi:nucleoside-diphosphate-sugar epimerase